MTEDDDTPEPVLVAAEEYVNATTETRYGSSGWQEPWTDDLGALYRGARDEFGRCIGHVFHDFGGKTYAVGWVFQGRAEYEGRTRSGEKTYLREVWLTLGLRDEAGAVFAYDVKRRRPVPVPGSPAQ